MMRTAGSRRMRPAILAEPLFFKLDPDENSQDHTQYDFQERIGEMAASVSAPAFGDCPGMAAGVFTPHMHTSVES